MDSTPACAHDHHKGMASVEERLPDRVDKGSVHLCSRFLYTQYNGWVDTCPHESGHIILYLSMRDYVQDTIFLYRLQS